MHDIGYITHYVDKSGIYCRTLQMLTNIENRLEELFQMIEMMPQEKVEAAEKVRVILQITVISRSYWPDNRKKQCHLKGQGEGTKNQTA